MIRFLFFLICTLPLWGAAQDAKHLATDSPYGSYVDEDFPFFSASIDARQFGDAPVADNLIPRAIIFHLNNQTKLAFDPDLLRVALAWKVDTDGSYLTMNGMAPGSYRVPNQKTPAGQNDLPKPLGTPLLANGTYAGWGKAIDPRDRSDADDGEVGLGPAPDLKWRGIEVGDHSTLLHYEVQGIPISEHFTVDKRGLVRHIRIEKSDRALLLNFGPDHQIEIPPVETPTTFQITAKDVTRTNISLKPSSKKRAPTLTTSKLASQEKGGFTIDEITLPLDNPWKRNIRLADIGFFKGGRAALVTFDGDVWLVDGLAGDCAEVQWSRFASGLHDPLGLAVVDEEIFVFDRNAIMRLHDRDKNGICDYYECYYNGVPQTAETREFANDIVAKPGGGFYLAKGGQVASTKGLANGTAVEVNADATGHKVIATGLRMAYLGIDPHTGMLTASDQQGHWKPTTPVRIIRDGEYYGFQPQKFKDKAIHPAPIIEPQVWIPHFVNQSGLGQVWLRDAQMATLNDAFIHIGYNRPELFRIYLDDETQGAVAPVIDGFSSGLLKAEVNPADGILWTTGFKIWGTSGEKISGLYRVRPNGKASWIPEQILSERRGVLLRFHQPVDPAIAGSPSSYSVDRWNYQRTHLYGSGNFRLDGEPGQESLPVTSVQLSRDLRSVFIGIGDMKPCHSLRVTHKIPSLERSGQVKSAYLTVHQLNDHDLTKRGFESNQVDTTITEAMKQSAVETEATAELGQITATKYGCIACHAAGDQAPPVSDASDSTLAVGPSWNGLWDSKREFTDGTTLKKTGAVYLRESILDPSRKVAIGYETEKTGVGMPSYLGVLKDHEIESIILFIKSLKNTKSKSSKKK
ncbi:MAG: DUF6797 domain-containing protein [Verrucomicrobiota bacterium]